MNFCEYLYCFVSFLYEMYWIFFTNLCKVWWNVSILFVFFQVAVFIFDGEVMVVCLSWLGLWIFVELNRKNETWMKLSKENVNLVNFSWNCVNICLFVSHYLCNALNWLLIAQVLLQRVWYFIVFPGTCPWCLMEMSWFFEFEEDGQRFAFNKVEKVTLVYFTWMFVNICIVFV